MKTQRRVSVMVLVLLLVGGWVLPTNATFTDTGKVTASLGTVAYVPTGAKAVQVANDSSGKAQLFVSWDAVGTFTDYRVEWATSSTAKATGSATFSGVTKGYVSGMSTGTWYIRISPTALTESGRSQEAKVVVVAHPSNAVTRITPACDGLAWTEFIKSCETKSVQVIGNLVYSVGFSGDVVVSLATGAAANTTPTLVASADASWVQASPLQQYGATSSATDGTDYFWTLDTQERAVDQEGIYKLTVSTKKITRVVKVTNPEALSINTASTTKRYWVSHEDGSGNNARRLSYCNTSGTCTKVADFNVPIYALSVYGDTVWMTGSNDVYRYTMSSGVLELVARFPDRTSNGETWANRMLVAVSETNAMVGNSRYGDRYIWNVSLNSSGVRASKVVVGLMDSKLTGTSPADTHLLELTRSGATWYFAVSGGENLTADGLWKFTHTPTTTPW